MFESRVKSQVEQVLGYESAEAKAKALSIIPVTKLKEEAQESINIAREFSDDEIPSFEDCLMETLLCWFKREFFTWVDTPCCWNCSNLSTNLVGMTSPSPTDLKHGAHRVEAFSCGKCGATSLFPRYNDPVKLLETRKGRCGEWANCFTFICRCLDLDVRFVVDWTDHVWTEYYSESKGRWIHADCCEALMDKPMLYESGWGKKLNYVIGVHRLGVRDVTRRYTSNWNDVLTRRGEVTESELEMTLKRLTEGLRRGVAVDVTSKLTLRDQCETQDLFSKKEQVESLPGRTTGSEEWRKTRGETGDSKRVLKPSTARFKRLLSKVESRGYLHDGVVRPSGENPVFETVECLFDGDPTTKWLDFGGGGMDGSSWIEYYLPKTAEGVILKSYALIAAKDTPERDPSDWELEGLVDGQTKEWKCLHKCTNAIFASRNVTLKFDISEEVRCRRFRLCIWKTRNPNEANSVQLSGFHLFVREMEDPEQSSTTTQVQQDFAAEMQKLFRQFVEEGLTPNEAAAKAIRQIQGAESA